MLTLYKKKGETPLQALERLRKEKREFAIEKLSYAGRLDPMAEGVMVVLVGDENKEREKYLGLDKTYMTEVLFGISTDTADILGKITERQKSKVESEKVEEKLKKMVGKSEQKYPAYSSKSFAGKYEDIRKVIKLSSLKVERETKKRLTHNVEMYSAELLEMREISAEDLVHQVKKDVMLVSGDFRQEEIVQSWESNLSDASLSFQIAKIRLIVSSGFYVRQYAEDLGESLGVPALALSILREKVGDWGVKECVL